MSIYIQNKRILIVKTRSIGDTILLTGPLRILKKSMPSYQIHVLVKAPGGALLEHNPNIDRLIYYNNPTTKLDKLAQWTKLIYRLREKKYEISLNFHASIHTAFAIHCLRCKLHVSNYHNLKSRNWFSDLLVPGRGQVKSIIDRDLDVLRSIGISVDSPELSREAEAEQDKDGKATKYDDAMPEVILTPHERQEAKAMLGMGSHDQKKYVFLGIGGSRPTKRWPMSHIHWIADKLSNEFDTHFVITTIPSDEGWLEQFLEYVKKTPALQKKILCFKNLPIRKSAALLSQCSFYVGNDSGLKHLAVALGLRTFTFFGPEIPLEWHPYNTHLHPYAFTNDLPCRTEKGEHWCSIPTCHTYQHQCMQKILPEQVWPIIKALAQACIY